MLTLKKIVSGGQTGVDRAGLDAAIAANIACGGWCPKGRLAELGKTIPEYYPLKESTTTDPAERTRLNIIDSDATLIVVPTSPVTVTDGTILTIELVKKLNKPYFILDLSKETIPYDKILQWLEKNAIKTLNLAGPRESQSPGIYQKSFEVLSQLFQKILAKQQSNIDLPSPQCKL